MEVKWFVFLTFAGLAISFVAGNHCSTDTVFGCYLKLVEYEGLAFPLYGEDEQELDDTCTSISEAFECVGDYLKVCNKSEDCDEKCKEMFQDIELFLLNTGLHNIQNELCDPLSPLRLTYLDNYVCLEHNMNHYKQCQNDSQMSQEYMSTITEREEAHHAKCCFFSWYEGCFTNITRESCNENATLYVSLSLRYLMGDAVDRLCKNMDIMCSKPPMPPEGKPFLRNNDVDNCTDEGCSSHSNETPHDEVDNCVDENCLSSSCILMLSVPNLFISLCCVALSKYLILIK